MADKWGGDANNFLATIRVALHAEPARYVECSEIFCNIYEAGGCVKHYFNLGSITDPKLVTKALPEFDEPSAISTGL